MPLQPLAMLAAVVRDDVSGEIRWPVVIGAIIAAGSIATAGWAVGLSNELTYVKARQEIVLQRIQVLEQSQHPSTAKRYTSDDAERDRAHVARELGSMDARVGRLEAIVTGTTRPRGMM